MRLFQITCLVVLLSVVVHGAGVAILLRRARSEQAPAPAPRPEKPEEISFGPAPGEAPQLSGGCSPSRSFASCRSAGNR